MCRCNSTAYLDFTVRQQEQQDTLRHERNGARGVDTLWSSTFMTRTGYVIAKFVYRCQTGGFLFPTINNVTQ